MSVSYTLVCWLFLASRLVWLFGFQHACNISVGSFWLSLRVKQKQPTQKPTSDETSNSINKSWIFTGIELSTQNNDVNLDFRFWNDTKRKNWDNGMHSGTRIGHKWPRLHLVFIKNSFYANIPKYWVKDLKDVN